MVIWYHIVVISTWDLPAFDPEGSALLSKISLQIQSRSLMKGSTTMLDGV